MSPLLVVRQFVASTNAHAVDAILVVMAADHCFVDSLGNRVIGGAMRAGWQQYFKMVPDYWIRVEEESEKGDEVVFFGRAGGTYVAGDSVLKPENKWETP